MGKKDGLKDPWKPGESGNPNGRPKGRGIKYLLEQKITEGEAYVPMDGTIVEIHKDSKTAEKGDRVTVKVKIATADQIVNALLANAAKGDIRHIKEVFDRLHGKAVQPHTFGDEDNPDDITEVEIKIVKGKSEKSKD